MARQPSRYQELWDAIKQDFTLVKPEGVTIATHKSLHNRIIKAIQDRKLRDTGAKYVWAEEGKSKVELSWDKDTQVGTIRFILLKCNITDEDL